MLHNMWHTCQLIMIVSLDIINNNQIRCHSLGFCNVTGTFIYFKTIKLAIATTLVVNVRVPFNFTTWNKVVYTSGYVITYIIKTTEPNHLILILNLANKSYFIIKVNFCHLPAWLKNYDPLKVGLNSFWDTLYIHAWRAISGNVGLILIGCNLHTVVGFNVMHLSPASWLESAPPRVFGRAGDKILFSFQCLNFEFLLFL